MASAARLARRGALRHRSTGGGGSIAHVADFTQNFTSATNSAAVTGITAASGTIAVAVINVSSGSTANRPTSIADAGGNTWTKQQESLGSSGQNSMAQIWTASITSGLSSGTVTITLGGSAKTLLVNISVWSGATLTGIVGANDNLIGTTSSSPASVTVTTAGPAAVIGGITYSSATAPNSGPGAGFTALAGASSTAGEYGASGYQIVSGSGTYGPTWVLPSVQFHGGATIGLVSL